MKSGKNSGPVLPQDDSSFLGPTRLGTIVNACMTAHLTEPAHGFVPRVRDRVRIQGADEIFYVIFVDLRQRVADLACAQRVGYRSGIPFKSITPAGTRAPHR